MAQNVEIKFEGSGTLIEDLRALADGSKQLAIVHRKAQEDVQGDLKKSGDEAKQLSKDMAVAAKTVVAIGSEASKTAKLTAEAIAQNRKQAAQLISDSKALTEVQKAQAAAAGGITKEYEEIVAAANKAKAAQTEAFEEPLGVLDQIQSRLDLLQQKKLSLIDEAAIAQTNDEIEALQVQFESINTASSRSVENTRSLRARIREAQEQAIKAQAAFGNLSPEFRAAAQEVARLQKELKDVQDRVRALNPGDKVAAFTQLGNAIASGAQAISGAAIAFGGNNQELQESLFKFQSLLFALQGAQAFIRDFKDGFDNIRAVLGLTKTAQVAATVATEADTVAKGANTATTAAMATTSTAAAGATGVFTGAIRTLTAAILANPIGALLIALGATVAIMLALADSAEDATKRIDGLINKFRILDASQTRTRDNMRILIDTQNELDLLAAGDKLSAQREQILRGQQRQVQLINDDVARAKSRQDELFRAVSSLDPFGENFEENRNRLFEAIDEQATLIEDAGTQRLQVEEQTRLALAKIDDQADREAIDRAKEAAERRLRINEELASALEGAEKELQDRLAQLRLDQADPVTKVELQRQASQQEVAILERNLLRVAALAKERVRIGDEAFSKLTERQKQARADALIDSGAVQLELKQQENLNNLRLIADEQYLDALNDAYEENARARLDLIADTNEKAREQFGLDLAARIDDLRKANATEDQIRQFTRSETERFNREAGLQRIDLEEQIRTAEVQARTSGGEIEKAFERRKQEEILAIRIDAAQKRLALLVDDGTQERQLERANLQALIADLQKQAATLKSTPLDINLLDLLGVAEEDQARVREAMASIFASTQQIISAGIAARRAEVDAAISATDEIISDAQRRRQGLQAELDQALEDQRNGYANNADAIRAQIEATKATERSALEEKKKQIEEQKRLARQQVLVDSASQASSLAVSVANLIKTWSTIPFGIGLISAFAQAAAIYAFVQSTRAKLKAASQGPQFRHGGRLKDSTLVGPLHEAGGIALLDRRTGAYYGEAEGGEGIVRRDAMRKRGDMVDAINTEDIGRLQRHARRELEASGHMVISKRDMQRLRRTAADGSASRTDDALMRMMLDKIEALREEVASFRKQEGSRPLRAGKALTKGNRTVTTR